MSRDDFPDSVRDVDEVDVVFGLRDCALPLLVVRVVVAGPEALRRVAVVAALEIELELS
jgi:hypothetical protein